MTQRGGQRWEQRAADYLCAQGCQIVARNWRCRFGELDLVVEDRQMLVIVEVRQRRNRRFGGAAASIHAGKQARICASAALFLQAHPHYLDWPVRCDTLLYQGQQMSWLQGAFTCE